MSTMSVGTESVSPVVPAAERPARTSRATTWVAQRFPVYSRACLLGAIFVAPVALNIGSLNVFMLVKVTSIWVFGVAALALWVAWSAERRVWLPPMRLGRLAGVFLAVCVLATITSTNPSFSLVGIYARYGGLIPLLLYASVAALIVGLYWQRPEAVREVAWAVTAGTAVLVGYVLIQAAGLDWSGWTDPASGQPPTYPGGTMGNSNFAGGYLAVALPLVAYTAFAAARRGTRIGLTMVLGLTALALWCTQTRGGMMGAAAGMATLGFLYGHHLPRWLRRAAAGGLAALVLVGALVIWHPGSEKPPGPLAGARVLSTSTLGYRADYWHAAGGIFADHPVLGTGPDTFFDHYTAYRLEKNARESGYVVPEKPHNIFFEYAANTGAAGILSYLVMVGAALRYGWRRARSLAGRQRLLVACFVASLVAYLVQGFFSIDVPPLALMGWVSLGALAVLADPRVVAARHGARGQPARQEPGDQPGTGRRRSRWAVRAGRAGVAGAAIGLLVVGTAPLRADVTARSGNLARAIRMMPLEASYRSQAGGRALQLAQAAQTPEVQREALDKAVERYRQGLDMRPRAIENMLGLAKTYTFWARTLDPTRFAQATAWWRRTIAQDPSNEGLRQAYEDQEQAQRNMAGRLEAALRVRPDRVGDLIRLGQVYLGLEEAEEARVPLEAALRLEPDNGQAERLLEQALTARARSAAG